MLIQHYFSRKRNQSLRGTNQLSYTEVIFCQIRPLKRHQVYRVIIWEISIIISNILQVTDISLICDRSVTTQNVGIFELLI
jgi:hypothetical protein